MLCTVYASDLDTIIKFLLTYLYVHSFFKIFNSISIIINGEILKFIIRAKGRRLVLRSSPFYVLNFQNRFVEASCWSNIPHPGIPLPIIISIVILRRNPTEGSLCSLGWREGLSSKDIKLLRSARKEKETLYFLSSEVTFAFAVHL